MGTSELHDQDDAVDAGVFSTWVREMVAAIAGTADADVPCGTCTGCCTSSQFVHVAPDEADALTHIPRELLFPAPRAPEGHVLMGYDERGHCPMLRDATCTIYDHRPRTCRTYDCRVFPAAGLDAGDDDKPAIAARARRWVFQHPTPDDRALHDAVAAASAYLRDHARELPTGAVPPTSTHRAALAVELHDLFVDGVTPSTSAVSVRLTRST